MNGVIHASEGLVLSEQTIESARLSFGLRDAILEAIQRFWEEQPDHALAVAEHVIWLAMAGVLMQTGKVIGGLHGGRDE